MELRPFEQAALQSWPFGLSEFGNENNQGCSACRGRRWKVSEFCGRTITFNTLIVSQSPHHLLIVTQLFPDLQEMLPIYVITGWLGAGKTTMLGHLTSQLPLQTHMKVALIENELGSAFGMIEEELGPMDHQIELTSLYELGFGCACCSGSGQLQSALEGIAQVKKSTHVVLETTGLADPQPILQKINEDTQLNCAYYIAQIITVIDVSQIESRLEERSRKAEFKNEPMEQVVNADTIILNKIDLVNEQTLSRVRQLVHDLNPGARILETSFGKVSLADLLIDGKTKSAVGTTILPHDSTIAHTALIIAEAVDLDKLQHMIRTYQEKYPLHLYRVKGLVTDGQGNKILVQGVGEHDLSFLNRGAWPDGEETSSSLALIGKNIEAHREELEKSFIQCSI